MNLSNEREIMVFARQGQYGNMYSIAISEKQQDGTYLQAYIPVWFRKGVELANKSMIKIKKAWLKPTKDMKVVIFVSEYEQVGQVVEQNNEPDPFEGMGSEVVLTEDDLPF